MSIALRLCTACALSISCFVTAALSQATLETQARQFLQKHGLQDKIKEGQTLLFAWDDNEAAFLVKESLPVQVPLSKVAATRPSKFEDHHVLYATQEDKDEKDTYDDEEDEFGGGGLLELLTGISEDEPFSGNVTIFTW